MESNLAKSTEGARQRYLQQFAGFRSLEGPVTLSPRLMRQKVRNMSVSKAAGYDGWGIELLRHMPVEFFEKLALFYANVESTGVWPNEVAKTVVVVQAGMPAEPGVPGLG